MPKTLTDIKQTTTYLTKRDLERVSRYVKQSSEIKLIKQLGQKRWAVI